LDEIKASIAQSRGAQAEELLNSEIFKETFAALEAEFIKTWRTVAVKDVEARERLWQAVNILGKVKEHLQTLAANGRLATRDLANIKYLKR
jgi:hypothetical protein